MSEYPSNFIGHIDDVMIYNRALGDEEVEAIYLRKPELHRLFIGLTDGESVFGYQRLEDNQINLLTGSIKNGLTEILGDANL